MLIITLTPGLPNSDPRIIEKHGDVRGKEGLQSLVNGIKSARAWSIFEYLSVSANRYVPFLDPCHRPANPLRIPYSPNIPHKGTIAVGFNT